MLGCELDLDFELWMEFELEWDRLWLDTGDEVRRAGSPSEQSVMEWGRDEEAPEARDSPDGEPGRVGGCDSTSDSREGDPFQSVE